MGTLKTPCMKSSRLRAAATRSIPSRTQAVLQIRRLPFHRAGYVNDDNVGVYGGIRIREQTCRYCGAHRPRAECQTGDMPYDYQQYIPATDGNSLVLTIDSDIQNILEKHLETALADNPNARDGVSGIVMDVKTGAVLAMANLRTSTPTSRA